MLKILAVSLLNCMALGKLLKLFGHTSLIGKMVILLVPGSLHCCDKIMQSPYKYSV